MSKIIAFAFAVVFGAVAIAPAANAAYYQFAPPNQNKGG